MASEGLSEATAALSVSASADLSDVQHPYTLEGRAVIGKLLKSGRAHVGQSVVVGGWVKTGRLGEKGALAFLELNDGSCPANLQVIVRAEVYDVNVLSSTGASVLVRGVVQEPPEGKKQEIEVHATEVLFAGPSDGKTYPVAKTKLTLEFLRSVIHFRVRTNTIAAITRIRNTLAAATHEFFQKNGFLYVHTPLITASDCEGAGEMFQITTLLAEADKLRKVPVPTAEQVASLQTEASAQGGKVKELKEAKAAKEELQAALDDLQQKRAALKEAQDRVAAAANGGIPRATDGSIDYSKDFFGRPAFLTVSGQLEAEIYACAMTNVYTFGPTFRAENSHTTRHLAEFWMIEPEIAFCDLQGNMKCAEDYVRYCCQAVLDRCLDDLQFLASRYDKDAVDRVRNVATSSFARISYTEAIDLLQQHVKEGKKKFEKQVEWGIDLQSEHERYLAEQVYKCPTIVYNYPKAIKSFYMRLNEDGKTVAAMDVLVPGVGELIGGSQREERVDVLEQRIVEAGLDKATYSWYLDLRRYGTVPHSGFGLGFERLILFTTGIENIRDVIPFPRFPGHIL